MTPEELKQKALSLPRKPGVYIMMDETGEVIYVGKAKALKNRVSQYFQDSSAHTTKTVAMVSQIDHFDTIIADSEFEALVLECSLIKRHQPKYNILLKDGKGYPFLRLDLREDYPRFSIVSRPEKDGAKYFGPYGGRNATWEVIRSLNALFRLPDCSKRFPRDIGRERPCLNFHMGKCMAVCSGRISPEEFHEILNQAVDLLEGRHKEASDQIKREMERAAENLEFEKAALLRDRYQGIQHLSARQKVLSGSLADTDVVGYYAGAKKAAVAVLHYREGQLCSRDLQFFSVGDGTEEEIVSAYLKQVYPRKTLLPRTILLPCPLEDEEILERLLTENAGRRVEIHLPQRGDRVRLVALAKKNAQEEVERLTTREERSSRVLEELAQVLALPAPPRRIEAFDVSNTGGSEVVAAMTVHKDAQPLKRDYRYFRIKSLEGQDDYHSMQEAVSRRFQRLLDGDEHFSPAPDLLLIDGGAVHAQAAVEVLAEMGLSLPVYGMVKDDRHRTRGLMSPQGEEIGLEGSTALFSLIGRIQEETHRSAITYHRKLRGKRGYASALDEIKGVGDARKRALLKQFKSVKAIREATEDQLREVVDRRTAQAVYSHFHEKD